MVELSIPEGCETVSILGSRYARSFFEGVAKAGQEGTISIEQDADGGMRIVVVADDGRTRPARSPRGTSGSEFFTAEEWFRFPLPLRERWWRETELGKVAPSTDLLAQIEREKGS